LVVPGSPCTTQAFAMLTAMAKNHAPSKRGMTCRRR
jgi:hypothetical protein